MIPDAGLTIALTRGPDDTVAEVAIASTRLVQASRLLAGLRAAEVTRLLPTVFALCGTAQAVAGMEALEQAAGAVPDPAQLTARRLLVLTETVAEHVFGIARDWPPLLGEPPALAAIKPLRPALAATRLALYPDGDWHRPGGGRLAPDPAALAGAHAALGAALEAVGGVARRLRARIEDERLENFGASPTQLMPAGGPADLAERLAADTDGSYLARPDCSGRVFETGPLARAPAHHGNGVLSRLTARLAEARAALRDLEELRQDLEPAPAAAELAGTGYGIGRVEAARGLLAHRAVVEEGVVRQYQILAPTEWNFHPRGPLALGLAGTPGGDGLEWRARLLAVALDPCVACRIEVA